MQSCSGNRLEKLSSGVTKGRQAKPFHLMETSRMEEPGERRHCSSFNEKAEGKKKGRPRTDIQELRSIPAAMILEWKEEFKSRSRVKCPCSGCWLEFPSIYGLKYHYQRCQGATLTEKLSHRCPYCEAVFASNVRLQKHKAWNHPERTSQEAKGEVKSQKVSAKAGAKKRPAENATHVPVANKVKRTHEASHPSQNGDCTAAKVDRKQNAEHPSSDASPKTPGVSEGGSLPSPQLEEDPERTRHRRKQKTPKKFTGEQPSISGTFGLKGMNKVEDKLKSARGKRAEGNMFHEEPVRRIQSTSVKKDHTPSSGSPEAQWQHAITERGEAVCPTCSLVTRKTVLGLRKHMEICQKLQDALKCRQCQKQFRSKAGLNYHTVAEHNSKPSCSEGQAGDEQEERDRLRRVLKQMGKIKCPTEGCSAHFSSLMGYQYHQKRCGRELSGGEKPSYNCHQCEKTYRSKAGRDYHVRSEHAQKHLPEPSWKDEELSVLKQPFPTQRSEEQRPQPASTHEKPAGESKVDDFERTPSGRVRRRSAQVAVFHLQEIAEDELARDWETKRRFKDDLVPDIKRLNYTRPRLPDFNPQMLENWKNEVKEKGFICCPNSSCEAVYSSVSGLKAHLASCNKDGGAVGKYKCLLCLKEFSSESGVKYHISKSHSQNWFRAFSQETLGKNQEPQNSIKNDLKNIMPGKKRGRKPKERPSGDEQMDKELPVQPKTQSPCSPPTPPAEKESRNRETSPLAKKRAKPKKLPATE